MMGTFHASSAFLVYNLIYWAIMGAEPPPAANLAILLFGISPDFDSIYHMLKGKSASDNTFQHHLYYWSHWPMAYWPLLLGLVIAMIANFYPVYVVIPVIGVYVHFVGDSMGCGDGMMWGKNPYKKEEFSPYINLFSRKVDGYHGQYWAARVKKTGLYWIGKLMSASSLVLLIFYGAQDNWLPILFIVVLFIVETKKVDKKYQEEPEGGRYQDYRENELYIDWMERNGYDFNEKHFARKPKKT